MDKQSTPSKKITYENNPFTLGLNGLMQLFATAQSVAIFLAIISGLSAIANFTSSKDNDELNAKEFTTTIQNLDQQTIIQIVALSIGGLLVVALLSAFINGIADYTSSRLAKNQKTTLTEAARAVWSEFPGYFWLSIIVFVKIVLWSLLFIIPGIIMSVRYSLAGVAYFSDNKRGNEAVKHSLALTKGAWLTTYASQQLWNYILLGMAPALITSGSRAILYRQFSQTTGKKPDAHVLSWLTLFVPIALLIMLFALIVFVVLAIIAIKF